MEEIENLYSQQYQFNTENENVQADSGNGEYVDLDKEQSQAIDELLYGSNTGSDNGYIDTEQEYTTPSSDDFLFADEDEATIKGFLMQVFGVEADTLDYVDIYNPKKIRSFLYTYLKDWYYPSKEVEAFAQFISNGGTLEQFIDSLSPVDFAQLSDEEAVTLYYQNKMDAEALEEYVHILKTTGKLEGKAKEIKKEIGVIQPTPTEIIEKQKELQRRQRQWIEDIKNTVFKTIKQMNLKFKNREDREEFVDLIVSPKHHYDDNGNLVFIGSEFANLLNTDPQALVLAAYHLYNYDNNSKREKAITETIDNIKKNLIQNRNLGIANFGL